MSNTAKIGDLEIAFDVKGEGPPLLCIMGLTGSQGHWWKFTDRFADAHRVITFDNRGVGRPAPAGPYSIPQMADDALGLLDHLGVASAAIFGVSMGGMIAQEIALRAPDRVTKLILGCTSAGGTLAVPPADDVTAAFTTIGKDGPEASIRRLLAINFSDRFSRERMDVFEDLVKYGLANRMSATGFMGQWSAVAMHDTASRVKDIKPPTLLITGEVDRLIPAGNTSAIAAKIPQARVVTLSGAGHMFWIEAADEAEAAMRAFLD